MTTGEIEVNSDQIARAELAIAIMNRARAMVSARINDIEIDDVDAAEALRRKRRDLLSIQHRIRVGDSDFIEAVITRWGMRVKDDALFWEEL